MQDSPDLIADYLESTLSQGFTGLVQEHSQRRDKTHPVQEKAALSHSAEHVTALVTFSV